MVNRYKKSLELQKVLDSPIGDDEFKLFCMREQLKEINEDWDPIRARLFHADAGLHVDDKLTQDSLANPARIFGEIILRGTVPEVRCIQLYGRYIITLPVHAPTVLGPEQEVEASLVDLEMEMSGADTVLPIGVRLARPIHIPVEDMRFSMLLAA